MQAFPMITTTLHNIYYHWLYISAVEQQLYMYNHATQNGISDPMSRCFVMMKYFDQGCYSDLLGAPYP